MEKAYNKYFEKNMHIIDNSLKTIDKDAFEKLINDCVRVIRSGNKIIASGLGKNVAVCEKFAGTMISLGMNAFFLNTNSAVHGDMGIIRPGDLLILLSKSGSTQESIYFYNLIKERKGVTIWLLSYENSSPLAQSIDNKIIINLDHEGDMWNIIPNNSTTINLIVLQELAIELSRKLNMSLEKDFKPNHPGGKIGELLRNE